MSAVTNHGLCFPSYSQHLACLWLFYFEVQHSAGFFCIPFNGMHFESQNQIPLILGNTPIRDKKHEAWDRMCVSLEVVSQELLGKCTNTDECNPPNCANSTDPSRCDFCRTVHRFHVPFQAAINWATTLGLNRPGQRDMVMAALQPLAFSWLSPIPCHSRPQVWLIVSDVVWPYGRTHHLCVPHEGKGGGQGPETN